MFPMKFQTLLNSSSFYPRFSHGCGGPGCSYQCSPLVPSVNQGFMSRHFKASRVLFTLISWEKVEACCGARKATEASPWFCRHEAGRLMKEASAKFFLHNGPFFLSAAGEPGQPEETEDRRFCVAHSTDANHIRAVLRLCYQLLIWSSVIFSTTVVE